MQSILPQVPVIDLSPTMSWFEKSRRKKKRKRTTTAKKTRMATVTATRSEGVSIATDLARAIRVKEWFRDVRPTTEHHRERSPKWWSKIPLHERPSKDCCGRGGGWRLHLALYLKWRAFLDEHAVARGRHDPRVESPKVEIQSLFHGNTKDEDQI